MEQWVNIENNYGLCVRHWWDWWDIEMPQVVPFQNCNTVIMVYIRQDGLTNNLHLNILDHAIIDPLHHIFWNIITSNIKSHSNSNRNKQKIFRVAKMHIYQTWIGEWSAPNSIWSIDHTTKIHGKLWQLHLKRGRMKREKEGPEKREEQRPVREGERGWLKRDTRSKGKERGREGSWR